LVLLVPVGLQRSIIPVILESPEYIKLYTGISKLGLIGEIGNPSRIKKIIVTLRRRFRVLYCTIPVTKRVSGTERTVQNCVYFHQPPVLSILISNKPCIVRFVRESIFDKTGHGTNLHFYPMSSRPHR
jgi:hypothetical protein